MSKRTIGILSILVSAVFFGFIPLFVKIAYANEATTLTAAFFRFAGVVPFLWLYLKVKGIGIRVTFSELKRIALISVFGYCGTAVLLFLSYNYISSGVATTVHFLYPAVTVFAAVIFYKKKMSPVKLLCMSLCIVGVIMFHEGRFGESFLGIIFAAASSVTYGFYTVYLGNNDIGKMNSLKMLFHMSWIGATMMLLLGLVTDGINLSFNPVSWGVMIFASVFATFIGAFGYQIGVKYVGSENAAMLSTFEPITSIVVGVLVYSEPFTLKTAVGCAAIIISTLIIARSKE